MPLKDRPLLYYSLNAFQSHKDISEIILVCGMDDIEFCRQEFSQKYGFDKISRIVAGGNERYESVYEGLKALEDCDQVLIHDGARPFVSHEIIDRVLDALPQARACVVGMPAKDTIKLANTEGYVQETPPRELLWIIQTPQAFEYGLIRRCYDQIMENKPEDLKITDDAMVEEYAGNVPVKLIEGSYNNIKVTTPEDILLAEQILERKK